jgi:lipoprotein-anchoring transpeptidase ErfK/SrfK
MKKVFNPKFLFLIVSVSTILYSCKKENADVSNPKNQQAISEKVSEVAKNPDSVVTEPAKESIAPMIQENGFYSGIIFPKDKKLRDSLYTDFEKRYTAEQRYSILALNRIDSKFRRSADTLVIPAKIDSTLMSYSPFPIQLDVLNDVKKFVIFSYPIQAYGVYSNGNLVKWGPTSMGKKTSQTTRGLTFANWKKKLAISTVKSEWKLPYNFNIHNLGGIGWHEYELPGYPASHSCLRLLRKDAMWLYSYADTWILNPGGATTKAKGTPVMVFGDYKWGGQKPWRKLLSDPNANNISVEEMEALLKPHIEKMIKEQTNREKVADSISQSKALEAQKIQESGEVGN